VVRDATTYRHFCVLARALERVGDRWTLLVVRDLSGGPRRFTDLMDRLGGITPKTLTMRLRELEADGLVEVERVPGRREVWYRLTPAGEDLRPALEELILWGLRHAARPPEPGEPAHPEHLLMALRAQLDRAGVTSAPVRWLVRILDGGTYVLARRGDGWVVEDGHFGDDRADVVITTTKAGLARFLTTPPSRRDPTQADLHITGSRRAVAAFLRAIEVFPFGRQAAATAERTGGRVRGL
jgi:DNA-binding HxlR family transcriptional regulator